MMSLTGWLGFEYPWSEGNPGGAIFAFGNVAYSHQISENWLTLNVGAAGGHLLESGDFIVSGSQIAFSYLMLNGDRGWEIGLWTDPMGLAQGIEVYDGLRLEVTWNLALKVFRFSVGGSIQGTNAFIDNTPFGSLVPESYDLPFIAAPSLNMAWRF